MAFVALYLLDHRAGRGVPYGERVLRVDARRSDALAVGAVRQRQDDPELFLERENLTAGLRIPDDHDAA